MRGERWDERDPSANVPSPTVNLHRTPYAGRHFECFSEDPLLTARTRVSVEHGRWALGPGTFALAAGSSSAALPMSTRITVA